MGKKVLSRSLETAGKAYDLSRSIVRAPTASCISRVMNTRSGSVAGEPSLSTRFSSRLNTCVSWLTTIHKTGRAEVT